VNMKDENKQFVYMEYLRVLSAFAVIAVHVSGADLFKLDIGSSEWTVRMVYNLFGRLSVCIFCMISGALMLRPGKKIDVHSIFHKYIKRILICYVVWVVLYSLLYTVMNQGDLQYFVLHLFVLPKHLWYLLMLIGLYLVTPVLKWITADRKITLYVIWICILFGGVFGTIEGVTGYFSEMAGESYGYSLWIAVLRDLENMNMSFVPGYLGLYLLGHYIHEYGLGKWHRIIVYTALPALILSAVLTITTALVTGENVIPFMLQTNPLIVLGSAGIFALFKGPEGKERSYDPKAALTKVFVFLGSNTFGIYLVHLMVIDILDHYLGFNVTSYPAILSVPVNSILVFFTALILAVLLKKIPKVGTIVT